MPLTEPNSGSPSSSQAGHRAARGTPAPPAARPGPGSRRGSSGCPAPKVSGFARSRVGGDVERRRARTPPGRGWRRTRDDHHDRALGEGARRGTRSSSSAIRAVNGDDRLVAQRPPRRRAAPADGSRAQQLPLVRVLGEQPHRVGELALGRVDAADQDVQHEVHAARRRDSRSPSSSAASSAEMRSSPGSSRAALEQLARRTRRTRRTACSISSRCSISVGVELPLDPVRPVVEPRARPRAARPSPSRSSAPGRAWRSRVHELAAAARRRPAPTARSRKPRIAGR